MKIHEQPSPYDRATGLHHDLDELAGVWTREEAAEFAEAIREFENIEDSPDVAAIDSRLTPSEVDQLLPRNPKSS